MKKRFWLLPLPIITLVLELLPWGAVLRFANPEGEPFRVTTSYFDLLPLGYANVGPFFTAVLSCVMFLFLVIYCLTGKEKLLSPIKLSLVFCVAFSLLPLFFGLPYYSWVAALITVSLAAELWLFDRYRKSL